MDVYDEMREVFQGAELGVPPIPSSMRAGLARLGKWAYATREIEPMDMYLFRRYIEEAITSPVDDYVAVSHAGHGVNSYSVNYHLVRGPLAVFAQAHWGGVYTDNEQAAARVRRMFEACAGLAEAAETSGHGGGRLVVVQSDFRNLMGYRWVDAPEPGADWRKLSRDVDTSPEGFGILRAATRLLAG